MTSLEAPPRSALETQLLALWNELLPSRVSAVDACFFDLGGTSVDAIRAINRIERTFGVRLPLRTLIEDGSIERVAAEVEEARTSGEGPTPLVPLQIGDSGPAAYLLHIATGLATVYVDLARAIDPAARLIGVEASGTLDGPIDDTVEAMASRYAEAILRHDPGPHVVVGYSYGGLVAVELAHRLGDSVAELILLDPEIPGGTRPPGVVDDVSYWMWWYGDRARLDRSRLAALDPDGQVDYVLRGLVEHGALPKHLHWSDRARARSLVRTQKVSMFAGWEYEPPQLATPALVMHCVSAPPFEVHSWDELLTGPMSRGTMLGDHYSSMKLPRVKDVAEVLAQRLHSVGRAGGGA
jgi:thioesterase domain-containing protein/acyl carrier protein